MTEDENPPSAAKVARRALVLAAVACCGAISPGAGRPEAHVLHDRVLEWLTRLTLWDEVEPSEERMLRATPGTLGSQGEVQALWYAEGLAVLAWALNRLELPRHDEQVALPAVADALWFLDEDAGDVIATARLRGHDELEACRELLYAIHCRLRDFDRNGGRTDFTGWIERSWTDALGLDLSYLIVGDDLAIRGRAIGEAPEGNRQEWESITRERHRAIIWLFEGRASYSRTPVDT